MTSFALKPGTPLHTMLVILRALCGDRRGNTLAIMAVAMFPLAAMVGAGLDMGRDYMVKSRLQSACDAGALATRTSASVSSSGAVTITGTPTTVGTSFFNNNFPTGLYGTSGTTFSMAVDTNSSSATYNQVNGTASTTVPMTIMSIFGARAVTINVVCAAKLDLANTDIMFVLDNTGSMADCPDNTSCNSNSSSKIASLKTAVVNFYTTLQSSVSTGTQVRYGFVPYTSTVNVGSIVYGANKGYISNSVTYQSAVANMTNPVYTGTPGSPSTTNQTSTQSSSSNCNSWASGSTSGGGPAPTSTYVTTYSYVSYSSSTRVCTRSASTVTTTYAITAYSFSSWSYQPVTYDTSTFKTSTAVRVADGTTPPSSFTITPAQYASKSQYNLAELAALSGYPTSQTRNLAWDGCIQEASTVANHAYTYSVSTGQYSPANPNDMNVDLVPTTGNGTSALATQWNPTWDDIVWDSNMFGSGPDQPWNYGIQHTGSSYQYYGYYACPTAAANLQVWSSSTAVQNYVNNMYANGGTYHDIGMVWGGRLISPTGIFASTNTAIAPNGQPITNRHIIFMTDGLMCPNIYIDSAWGYEKLDKRILGSTSNSGTANCSTQGATGDELAQRHVSRLLAICNEIKAKNITIWTIDFGVGSGGSVDPNLQACSTNNGTTTDTSHAFYAADSTSLNNVFTAIAKSVSKLKLTS